MHVPLDEHLHTDECNKIIKELQRCHDQMSLFRQFFGACNQLDFEMRKCTKKERLAARDANKEDALDRQKKMADTAKKYKGKDWRDILKEKEEELKKEAGI
eukprot:TRINITY_DN31517_c0_g1_i1.p1 TRINITY_DN31517_c0_g1~~TRINITY_DN31517_c0_g1_i1.p1  ORF type:complete len:101 (+),score=22.22 TRINITY_DN31517_c0_g1_i1:63-365(+)